MGWLTARRATADAEPGRLDCMRREDLYCLLLLLLLLLREELGRASCGMETVCLDLCIMDEVAVCAREPVEPLFECRCRRCCFFTAMVRASIVVSPRPCE